MTTAEELQELLAPNASPFIDVSVPTGWLDLVVDCHKRLVKVYPDYQIAQIKEKFGGLRYYTGPIPTVVSPRFMGIVRQYEDKSFQTCQSCGKPGQLNTISGWYYTLCQEHEDKTREWAKTRWA